MYYKKVIKTITLKIREPEKGDYGKMNSSKKCYEIAKEIYKDMDDDQEHFTAFFLNSQNEVKAFKTLFTGGQQSSIIDIKVIFRHALLNGACAMIICHNHPSGDIIPSPEDKKITEDIIAAGKILAIKVHDHIIMGDNNYFSFYNKGLI